MRGMTRRKRAALIILWRTLILWWAFALVVCSLIALGSDMSRDFWVEATFTTIGMALVMLVAMALIRLGVCGDWDDPKYDVVREVHKAREGGDDSAAANVQRGARLLDDNVPGWEWKVDPETVGANAAFNCPLAQIYQEQSFTPFNAGLRALGVARGDYAWLHGFVDSRHDPHWREEILKRRGRS